jgi:Domain of unknown function (DUF4157)
MKPIAQKGMIQRSATNSSPVNAVPPIVHEVLNSPGRPLEMGTREFMESRFGEDFSGVRVHMDSRAAESARAVNALAYTVGYDVVFGAGQYQPQRLMGKHLIAHELAHVIQQKNVHSLDHSTLILQNSGDDTAEYCAQNVADNLLRGESISPSRSINGLYIQKSIISDDLTRIWRDTFGNKGRIFDRLRAASPCSSDVDVTNFITQVFSEQTDDLWLARAIQENGPENLWSRTLLDERNTRMTTNHWAAEPRNIETSLDSASPSLHIGIIPIREFIQHVEMVERAYPGRSPQEILTMIRSLYYGAPAGSLEFNLLLPDAPSTGAVEMCHDSEGSRCEEPVGTCTCYYAQGLAMDVSQLRSAVSRLRQHADENEIADNPSPYIEVGTDLIDVGHLLVGVDAILHPRTSEPYAHHGLTSAPGPATWEGDVGAGMVYLAEHQSTRHQSADVRGNPAPTVESYYRNSAPRIDIFGDVDAFGMASLITSDTLSAALRQFYISESGGSPRYQYNRWAGFCSTVGLTYQVTGRNITWRPEARALVITRITAFANLYQARNNRLGTMISTTPARVWSEAGRFADLFLADVKLGLEQEIAANSSSATLQRPGGEVEGVQTQNPSELPSQTTRASSVVESSLAEELTTNPTTISQGDQPWTAFASVYNRWQSQGRSFGIEGLAPTWAGFLAQMREMNFLGHRVVGHEVFLNRLHQAEFYLHRNYHDVEPQTYLGTVGRPGGRTQWRADERGTSYHVFGMAIDIDASKNPWIANPEQTERSKKIIWAIWRAVWLIGNGSRPIWPSDNHTRRGSTTESLTHDFQQTSNTVKEYFELMQNESLINTKIANLGAIPFIPTPLPANLQYFPANYSIDLLNRKSVSDWQSVINLDKDPWKHRGSFENMGFFNLNPRLVEALRDHARLNWGAVDLGNRESGDFMHFDLRSTQFERFRNEVRQAQRDEPTG